MGVAAVEGFWPGGAGAGMALAFLALCAIGVPAADGPPDPADHPRHPAPRGRRARLLDLYGRARQDALLDGLTGLGNHRALPGGAPPPAGARQPAQVAALPAADRRRRPQEGQRRARPRRRRRAAGRGRAHRDRRPAPRRPRLPGRRRRVRRGPAGRRRRDRPDRRATDARRRAERGVHRQRHRAVLAVDRHLRLPGAEHRATCSTATPTPRCTGASATAGQRRGVRPGPPRRPRRRPVDRGAVGGARDDPGREVAAARLPADLLADHRRADRLRGPDPPDRHGADGRCQQPLRRRRARRPDGRAGHGLPRGGRQRRQRPRAGHVPQRQPLAADPRVRPVPPDGADGDLPPPRHRARRSSSSSSPSARRSRTCSSCDATPRRAAGRGCASPPTTSAPATPGSGCSPRSTSTSSRSTCRWSRAGSCTTRRTRVLRALQELAARWSATIIAEGVETGEQLAVVRELGITAGQGYLLGRPGPRAPRGARSTSTR